MLRHKLLILLNLFAYVKMNLKLIKILMSLNRNDLKVGKSYYHGNCIRKFKCLKTGEVESSFKDYTGEEYQLHNHEMYINKIQ